MYHKHKKISKLKVFLVFFKKSKHLCNFNSVSHVLFNCLSQKGDCVLEMQFPEDYKVARMLWSLSRFLSNQ